MKKHILATFIAAASISNLYAESLFEVYKLAQEHDPSLRAAAATYDAQKEEVTITKGNLYPSITFNGNLGYTNSDSRSYDGSTLSNALSLNMNYPIYSPALGYAVDAVEINFDSAAINYENAKENLALISLTEYFDLLTAQATLKNTEAQVLSNASQLDRVKKQFDVGLVSITDLQDAQAAYDAVKVNSLSAYSSVLKAQQALFQRTGKQITSIPELSKGYKIQLDNDLTVEQLIKQAKVQNTDIKTLDLAVQAAEKNIQIEKSNGRSPTVVLTGALSQSDADSSPNKSSDGNSTDASIGIGVSVPLYKGGAINASVRKASSTAEAVRENRAAAIQTLELNLRSLYLDLETSVAQIEAQSQLVKSRTSALEATQAGYDAGIRNLVELLTAQSNLYDAQNTYQQLRYGFVVQKLNLLELTGNLSEDEIRKLGAWLK
ncbi:TolC family outer membrane protein [Marinomonas sp. 15G1-11]|uniref:TolC family outer membrane protein n=1 Tax=Marinomonas phaeophyticola TaxID=3004091 RepID=A0ABT4JRS8_9GAMM|nr:TolC family outer membrane protein [Marinomonas sp. 15G1-11]MCZ2720528.1 TolC family outer membrane protein [Marinomonas sp. 15G1-11]